MADVIITIANMEVTSNTITQKFQCGEAVTAGQWLYLKPSDGKYWLSLNATEEESKAVGVCVTPTVDADGYAVVATAGDIVIGGTLAAGTIYVVSSTAGAIHPTDDLLTTEWVTAVGIGMDTEVLRLGQFSGVAHV